MHNYQQRRRQFPRAALVGLLAGLVSVAFHSTLNLANQLRNGLLGYAHSYPLWGVLIPIILCALGAGVGVWLVQRFAPETAGSGIPHVELVLHHLRRMTGWRILFVKFTGGVLSIGSGLALGREGPTVQMGGAFGQIISRWLRSNLQECDVLIAAGSGAGLAATFNAPLAGVLFVIEELEHKIFPTQLTAAFVACVVADTADRLLGGQQPDFSVTTYAPPLAGLPVFAVLGLLAGFLGVVYNRGLLGTLRLFDRLKNRWPQGASGAVVGAGVGLLAWFMPGIVGGGDDIAAQTLQGQVSIGLLPLLFLGRFALTMFSYGCGAPGGIFAPLLVLGAQLGLFTGSIGNHLFPSAIPELTSFAIVGMAAYFTAIVRAPLTGIALVVEMTDSYTLILAMLVACYCAYGVADLLRDQPIYEALQERNLSPGAKQKRQSQDN